MSAVAKKRIAWVSPLSRSLGLNSAAFSHAILPPLSKIYSVECFVDDLDFEDTQDIDIPVYHYHRLSQRNEENQFDFFVYQIENSLHTQFVRLCARVFPGVCYLHDLVLNKLYYGLYKFTTAPTELNKLVENEFGSHAPRIGDYHVRGWSYELFDRFYAFGRTDFDAFAHNIVFRPEHRRYLLKTIEHKRVSLAKLAVGDMNVSSQDKGGKLRVVISPEQEYSDRVNSIFSAIKKLDLNEIEVCWIHPNSSTKKSAERYCANHLNLDLKHQILCNTELASFFGEKRSVYLSLRTEAKSSWPFGLPQALAMGVPVIAARAQFSNISSSPNLFIVEEGIGDDIWVRRILESLVSLKLSPNKVLNLVNGYLAAPEVCAQELSELLDSRASYFAEEMAKKMQKISKATSELIAPPVEEFEPMAQLVESLFEDHFDSLAAVDENRR